jgi:hypothetical protein
MKYLCYLAFFVSNGLFAQFENVLISTLSSPNEPCIMMDPKNPNVILAAANLNNYYLSQDTGRTWTSHTQTSSLGVWGDPVLIVDTTGDFYYFHLSNPPSGNWIDRIVCQKTSDQGNTWTDGNYMGLNGSKAQDKEWGVVDRTNNNIYVTWTQFDDYGSSAPGDSSVILFAKSTDNGDSWSEAKRINKVAGDCIDSDNTTEGAVPAVGPNGEIYVAWAGPSGLTFNRSMDEGETWLDEEIFIDAMPTGWDYAIPGIYRANGLPVTTCDLSGGENHGTIYVNWSDQRNGEDDTDIWLSKSNDGGDTWSEPVRVNDDPPGKHQFFTWMAVDQVTGVLYFVFYDRRNHSSIATDVYMAVSEDGGETFTNVKISDNPFLPNSGVFFGDYTNITVHNGIVRPIWARLNGTTLSIWTALINFNPATSLETQLPITGILDLKSYPNPAINRMFVSFKLHQTERVHLEVINSMGKKVETWISNEQYPYGKHVLEFSTHNFEPGLYYYVLSTAHERKTKTFIVQ